MMNRKRIFQIAGAIGALFGILSFLMAAMMWLGSVVVTPLGFLFGLGEAGNYETLLEKSVNLFWHVVPGIVGAAIALTFLIFAILLLWGSRSVWSRAKELSNKAAL